MFSENLDALGRKHAGRIWSFMSKFIVLDRFCKTLGVAGIYPGCISCKKAWSLDYFGTASKASDFFLTYFSNV
jgi:hypothetical protein